MRYKEKEKTQTRQIDKQTTLGIKMLIRILTNEKLSTDTCIELQTRMDPHKIKIFLLPGIPGYRKRIYSTGVKDQIYGDGFAIWNNE